MDRLSAVKIHWLSRTVSEAKLSISHLADVQNISGQLRGPFCRYSRTLPSNHRIVNGQAVIVDPCYWTPKLPFYYEITLESAQLSEPLCFNFGLRWCIPHRNVIRLDGKPYVFRAIMPKAGEIDLLQLREASASLAVSDYVPRLFKDASELGVMVSVLTCCEEPLDAFPSVHFAEEANSSAGIISLSIDSSISNAVRLTEESELEEGINYREKPPMFVVRRGCRGDVSVLRAECDRLQRDVARFGQFAGYLIDAT